MNRLFLFAALAAGALAAPAASGKTQIFLETGEAEFSQGHADGIVWTSLGTLRLGRAVEKLLGPTEGVEYVARLAEGRGGAVFAVTGGTGRVYRIRDGKAALWATLPDKFLFSCAADKAGNLYVGTGGAKGRVWRLTPQPKGEPKAEVFFEADGVRYVWDLAWLKDGALAAATGDKGKIFRITPDGKGECIIDSEADHVLCLAAAPDGTLYAGTDGPSVVYRWDGKKAFILYDADEAEITALALDDAGNLFVAASGAPGGRAGGAEAPADTGVKITLPGAPSPAPRLDSTKEAPPPTPGREGPAPGATGEVPAPGKDGSLPNKESAAPAKEGPAPGATGEAPAPGKEAPLPNKETSGPAREGPAPGKDGAGLNKEGAAPGKDGAQAAPSAAVAPSLAEAISAARSSAAGRPATAAARAAGASVYRIAPDGLAARVFEGRDAMILALAVAEGRLLIGTGKSARIYETGCRMDEEEACVAALDPKQVMSLLVTRDGRILAGSAGPGRVYALSGGCAREGTYTSQVYDAGGSARWGALDWRGHVPDGTEIALATRTGNVRDPEKGMWSDWSKEMVKPGAKIQSPPARFIQFRVTMRGRGDSSTPVLEQFQAAYERANEPPRVTAVTERITQDQAARAQAMERFRQSLKPPPRTAGSAGAPAPAPAPAAPPPPEGPQPIRIIQWQASDPNGDTLRYDIYMRSQGEPAWILLEKDLVQPQYAWDTATVADGWYELKVVASDRADNPEEVALEGFKVSDPILVDNTAPVIENLQVQVRAGGEAEVRFTARDAAGRLTAAAYTVDSASDWRPIAPTDGLFDGRQKEFRFTVRKLSPGPHRLAVRVADEANNFGHAAQTVTVGM